jgi:uncharacterized OB-fold protein
MTGDVRDEGYDDFVDAVAAGEAYYLECEEGHGSLPPRSICPECGSRDLSETTFVPAGDLETYTVTNVATPDFTDDVPYVTAIADLGPVHVTAHLRGVDHDEVRAGLPVELGVEERETNGEPLLVFRPR